MVWWLMQHLDVYKRQALKRGKLLDEDYTELFQSMTQLNALGFELGKLDYVTAITDVTGFGFLGHLLEMIGEQNLTAVIEKNKIKTFKNLQHYISQFIFPDNTTRNFNAYESKSKGMVDLDFISYCDPQTSGGLLFAIDIKKEAEFEKWMKENKQSAYKIGEIKTRQEKQVEFI